MTTIIKPDQPFGGNLAVHFALRSETTYDEAWIARKRRNITPRSDLHFFKDVLMWGRTPIAVEITDDVRQAKQFATRATAKRAAEKIGRAREYRVVRVAVPT